MSFVMALALTNLTLFCIRDLNFSQVIHAHEVISSGCCSVRHVLLCTEAQQQRR